MTNILLAVMEVLGISHLVADGQFALGDQIVVATGDLALNDHDLLHVGAEVDGSNSIADILREVIVVPQPSMAKETNSTGRAGLS